MLGRGPDRTSIGVSFLYDDGRSHAVAKAILSGVTGSVLTDGYDGYAQACKERDDLVHGLCWAHARRKYHEALLTGQGQAASVAIKWIADLYAHHRRIETFADRLGRRWNKADAQPDYARIDAVIVNRRQKWMKPVVDELEAWNARMVQSATPKGKFGEAIGYFRNQSVRLRQFLTNARLDLDNNIIERSIHPIAIGRKNWMFAGSEEGARRSALLMSLVGSCKLLGIDPAEYLGDVLLRAKACQPTAEGCADLTPSRWKAGRAK